MENSELQKLIKRVKWQHSLQGCNSLNGAYDLIKVYFANNDDYQKLVSGTGYGSVEKFSVGTFNLFQANLLSVGKRLKLAIWDGSLVAIWAVSVGYVNIEKKIKDQFLLKRIQFLLKKPTLKNSH